MARKKKRDNNMTNEDLNSVNWMARRLGYGDVQDLAVKSGYSNPDEMATNSGFSDMVDYFKAPGYAKRMHKLRKNGINHK